MMMSPDEQEQQEHTQEQVAGAPLLPDLLELPSPSPSCLPGKRPIDFVTPTPQKGLPTLQLEDSTLSFVLKPKRRKSGANADQPTLAAPTLQVDGSPLFTADANDSFVPIISRPPLLSASGGTGIGQREPTLLSWINFDQELQDLSISHSQPQQLQQQQQHSQPLPLLPEDCCETALTTAKRPQDFLKIRRMPRMPQDLFD